MQEPITTLSFLLSDGARYERFLIEKLYISRHPWRNRVSFRCKLSILRRSFNSRCIGPHASEQAWPNEMVEGLNVSKPISWHDMIGQLVAKRKEFLTHRLGYSSLHRLQGNIIQVSWAMNLRIRVPQRYKSTNPFQSLHRQFDTSTHNQNHIYLETTHFP